MTWGPSALPIFESRRHGTIWQVRINQQESEEELPCPSKTMA